MGEHALEGNRRYAKADVYALADLIRVSALLRRCLPIPDALRAMRLPEPGLRRFDH